ncbi:MAG: hypothetical protein Q9P44_00345 [Anaerolineae bacterium]|nr:hypothetical protein [Anaerolineae bacterium]
MIQRIVLILIGIFALSACSGISINQGEDGQTILTISLTETEFNTLISSALANADEPLVQNANVDFQNGQVVISGENIRQGGGQISGTATMTIETVDGVVNVQIVSVDAAGIDITDDRITTLNQQLSQALAGLASENNSAATLESITITDDALQINIAISTNSQE